MLGFLQHILHVLYMSARPLLKGVLRRFTRLCELQRICYGLESGAARTLAVEKSLSLSRNPTVRGLVTDYKKKQSRPSLEGTVTKILRIKKINPQIHPQFSKSFGKCLHLIWAYDDLMDCVEALRRINYDSENNTHENRLISLWANLVPEEPLKSRVTKQWGHIGFQGDDPKTDFRGMGLLGLENLVYFSAEHTSIAQRVLTRSHHPAYGYSFAIVGINLTHLAYYLMKDGSAKTHMYNVTRAPMTISTFHEMYCYLFVEFDKFWLNAKPENIMNFSSVLGRFERNIREKLKDERTCFRLFVNVDSI